MDGSDHVGQKPWRCGHVAEKYVKHKSAVNMPHMERGCSTKLMTGGGNPVSVRHNRTCDEDMLRHR